MRAERKKLLLVIAASVAATLAVLGLGGLVVMYTGLYNVAATDEHTGLVRWALRTTTINSIEARAPGEVDLPDDEAALLRGFRGYEVMCVDCHGAPGVERGWIGQGIRPTGPDLAEVAAQRTPGELLWAIEHGIKFTGMPALSPTHSREQMLEVTAFVVRLKDLNASDYAALRQQTGAGGDGHGHGEPADASPSAPAADDTGDRQQEPEGGHDGHDHAH